MGDSLITLKTPTLGDLTTLLHRQEHIIKTAKSTTRDVAIRHVT